MSKLKSVAKGIKYIFVLLFYFVKYTVLLVPLLLTQTFKLIARLYRVVNKRLKFSITFKTTFVYTLVFSSILFVLGLVLMGIFGGFLAHKTKGTLEKSSVHITRMIDEAEGIPEARIKEYADVEEIHVSLFKTNGEILFTTWEDKSKAVFRHKEEHSGGMHLDSNEIFYFFSKLTSEEMAGYIQITKNMEQEGFYMGLFAFTIGVSFLFTVIITIVVGSKTGRKMLKPIYTMTNTAKSISAGALHTRLDVVDSHDELKELAQTFNAMLDRIQVSYEQQNQFVSDASHELRTPISVIQGYANLLQRWGKEDKGVLDESIQAIRNESENMKVLVENLLFLARTDKNTQKIEKFPTQVDELIEEVIRETRLIDKEHSVINEINEAITLHVDRALIKQALRVFVDNSIKYTPEGGTIKINSIQKNQKAIITISDTGIGISKEDLPHIFNRFYKCDKSRTREGGGTGLGLSIAKWIIEGHQGSIQVESEVDKGTKVIITLSI